MHLFTQILSLVLPLVHVQCHQEVLLTSNSPAVLDAPITFYGRLVSESGPLSLYFVLAMSNYELSVGLVYF